ncbi:NAD(P)-dependent oxidoreductase [Patescibacteria group bacterium AH-259-L05]|nr:NAD(P)-dependent oxidoreductase [Patescibacteria group bacterium AH-259-L05]
MKSDKNILVSEFQNFDTAGKGSGKRRFPAGVTGANLSRRRGGEVSDARGRKPYGEHGPRALVSGNVLITGGSGSLGTAIQKLISCDAPDRSELDIRSVRKCEQAMKKYKPDIIIHAGAYTDVSGAEKHKKACWDVNVIGTENLVRAVHGRRFIYISTSYVFDGEKGDYTEDDIPDPVNFYSLTKLLGEIVVSQYKNTLIIRTMFKPDGPWSFKRAFVDQITTAEFVSDIAPDIVKASLMQDLFGIIHISGTKKTIYELAQKVSPQVGKMSIKDVDVMLPKDISLNNELWKKLK